MDAKRTDRGWVGSSIATLTELKAAQVLSGANSDKLDAALQHMREADRLCSEIIAEHEGNMAGRNGTQEPEPTAADVPEPVKSAKKPNMRFILGGGR